MKRKYFEILLENIEKKVDLVFEGHQVLDGKISTVDKKVDELKIEMLDIKQFFIHYLEKVNSILDNHEKRILTLEAKAI